MFVVTFVIDLESQNMEILSKYAGKSIAFEITFETRSMLPATPNHLFDARCEISAENNPPSASPRPNPYLYLQVYLMSSPLTGKKHTN